MRTGCVEWATADSVLEGQIASGDLYVVWPRRRDTLLAVVDGLGHGPEALLAAARATRTLQEAGDGNSLDLIQRCHRALTGTRGAVISLGLFPAGANTLEWIGVGNVTGLLLRHAGLQDSGRARLLQRAGVVGDRLPSLVSALVPLSPGDTVVLATDGIRPDFERSLVSTHPPQVNADRILANHGTMTDDALVLVARYIGDPAAA